ncbi:replication-associated recombination protein A [Patescibacteria group bacterium]|nr:replication-associated recombination protein A [Patescibacteria group bacterium]MCL5409503.1 replication-associated recombination protein A [Patescibacteria group bacterium]
MTPLADRLRPQDLSEYIGQKHILAEDKLLYKAIKNKQLFSMIFWGPPGVGKTTLARIIAKETEADFMEFSAVTTSTVELKKIFAELDQSKKQTVIFIDEIHRFNKAQQDAFLRYVENGTITLIGATTENPSFEVIGPLLSRSRVFVLQPLSKEEIKQVIQRALTDKERGFGRQKIKLEPEALELLLEASYGDARVALTTLEVAVGNIGLSGQSVISRGDIEESFQRKMLMYDKAGEEHYNTISAFIKSMRASNTDAALYYLARMVEVGEDPLFIARRMVVFASEDIGLAQPTALVVANAVFEACHNIGFPECQENLAHGVAYLAQAKKDRSAYDAYFAALIDVKKYGHLPIPMKLRNAPTRLMKELGYGAGYEKYTNEDLLPEQIKGHKYLKKG